MKQLLTKDVDRSKAIDTQTAEPKKNDHTRFSETFDLCLDGIGH